MRIGINAKYAFDQKVRGIGKYTLKLIQNLVELDNENTYILYIDKIYSNNDIANNLPSNFILKSINQSNYLFYEQIFLPKYIKKDNLDLFHATGNTFPIFLTPDVKLIVTVHDVMFFKNSDIIPSSKTLYQKLGKTYRKINLKFLNKVDKIITVSNFSKKDIHRETECELSKIEVTRLGFESSFLKYQISPKKEKEYKERFGIKNKFFYHLGGDAPNKNTEQVIKIYSKLPQIIKNEIQLVITGIKHEIKRWREKVKKYKLEEDRVIFTRYVTDDELMFLYHKAELFLFLSLYEGFGIPVLEAMSSKTPVIASNRSVIPEVVGKAGIIVDPDKEEEVVKAIISVLEDQQIYDNLIKIGLDNLKRFSWLDLAKSTLEIYNEVLYL